MWSLVVRYPELSDDLPLREGSDGAQRMLLAAVPSAVRPISA